MSEIPEPPLNLGYDAIELSAQWQRGPLSLTLSDGAILEPCQKTPFPECGAMAGGREVFEARLGYFFKIH